MNFRFHSLITSLLSLIIIINFATTFIISDFKDNELIALEFDFDSNVENAESELDAEKESRNIDYLSSFYQVNFSIKDLTNLSFIDKSLSYENLVSEVPTSPPNNC